ncbi:major facilitator superfamily domain-containing protein [Mycena floridula]|nr:major facilitator superfamily domain-containing protein [Mycena floridula]
MSLSFKDYLVILAVSGTTTLNIFLSGALNIALPTIGKDLKFDQARSLNLQWPVNVFSLSYGCLLLFFGHIGDLFSSRLMFLAGSAWFGVWSLAAAFIPNDVGFIILMALLGIGAAANTPTGIGLLVGYFPPGPRRNQAFGIFGAGQPLGFILGIILAGVIVDSKATWRGIFYIQAGLSACFVLLGWFVLPRSQQHTPGQYKGIDWRGAILSISGIGLLTYSLADSTSTSQGWASPRIIACTGASVTLIVLFWYCEHYRELKGRVTIMPPSIWTQPGAKMIPLILVVFLGWWSFNTFTLIANLYYQQVLSLSPLNTSIRFIPMVITGFSANFITGWLMNHVPGQILILVALSGTFAAPLIFALMDFHKSYWVTTFWCMILTVTIDIAYPVGTLQISAAFDESSQSLAGGIFNVATRLGTSIGIAISSSVATSVTTQYVRQHPEVSPSSADALMAGFRAAGWTMFGAALLGFVIAAVGLRGMGIVGKAKPDPSAPDDIPLQDTWKPQEFGKMNSPPRIPPIQALSPIFIDTRRLSIMSRV